MHHTGSASISGLGGKGMVDIMGIKSRKASESVVNNFRVIGLKHAYLRRGDRALLNKIGPTNLGDARVHTSGDKA